MNLLAALNLNTTDLPGANDTGNLGSVFSTLYGSMSGSNGGDTDAAHTETGLTTMPLVATVVEPRPGSSLAFIGSNGSIAGSTINLNGVPANKFISDMHYDDRRALSGEDRAEIVRQIGQQRASGQINDFEMVGAINTAYNEYKVPPARLSALDEKAQDFSSKLKAHSFTIPSSGASVDLATLRTQWPSLSVEDRTAVLNEVHKLQASVYGFTPTKVIAESTNRSYYDPDDNTLHVGGLGATTGRTAQELDYALTHVFHEGIHAYQDWEVETQLATGKVGPGDPSYGTLALNWANMYVPGGYYNDSSKPGYLRNPIEQEAWHTTDTFRKEALGLDTYHLGDAGDPGSYAV